MKYEIKCQAIENLPWKPAPQGCDEVIWRDENNPVLDRKQIKNSNSVFNSAVVLFGGGFRGVFRSDDTERIPRIYAGKSKDGIHWELSQTPISFLSDIDAETDIEYGYDPRVCFIEDRYYITWCNSFFGPTIGVAYTFDFEKFYQLENAFLPYNRNGVLFPRKIGGNFAMLSRPSDTGHTPFGDIFYSESPDLVYWGKHRHVMGPKTGWQSKKIGGGPVPIETDEGWLILYHGVLYTCNGFTYSAGAALLDLEQPWKVLYRTKPYILAPREIYECTGDVPNVVFPCTALCDSATGRITIYYGAADTVIGMAYTTADTLIDFVKEHSF